MGVQSGGSNAALDRREFLQAAAGAAAAVAMIGSPGRALAQDQPAAAAPATSPATTSTAPKLRVAAIGCGGKGWDNLRGISRAGAEIVALCDVDSNQMTRAAGRFPGARHWADYRKMLDEQKDIEAVIVSTPDHTHAPAAMMAMRMGKGVYCEKPLTHSIHEARVLTETARQYKVATQMGNQGHSMDGTIRTVEWVKSGAIGPVREVHAWTDRPIWPQDIDRPTDTPAVPESINWDCWLGPAPQRPWHPAYHPFRWRGFWDFGTGALGDMACHLMDAAFWALDLRNPAAVQSWAEGGNAESAPRWSVVRYDYPALGERPPLRMYWYDGGLMPPTKLSKEPLPRADGGLLFVGERAALFTGMFTEPKLTEPEKAADIKPPDPFLPRPGNHHQQWVHACIGGDAPSSNFDYAGPLSEMVLLGNLALRTGQRVEWDAASMTCTNIPAANQLVRREYRKGWEL
jgi:hypothetical protein